MDDKPSIESLLFKHIKDGPAGYVIRMREAHGTWVEDGVLRGCRCGEAGCTAFLWLAHIDNLKADIDQIRGQFQRETSANAALVSLPQRRDTMKIEIQRNESSLPLTYDAINAYTKGPMYCVLFVNTNGERVTHKFPICGLFRVIEEYPDSKR